jgi:hypothetical protein
VILAQRGNNPGPPRRPFEYATLTAGPEFASVQIDAEVRIDEPVTRNDRDVLAGGSGANAVQQGGPER